MRRETLLDFFESFATNTQEFLVHFDGYRSRSHTYSETAGAARTFAARLRQAGLTSGDRVLFWGENRPEWIVAMWGCLLRGIVVVPLDYRSSGDLLCRVQSVAQAKLLLTGDEISAVPSEMNVSVWPMSSITWEETPAGDNADVSVARNDTAEILFTSGATAEPKGVIIQHKNVLANIIPVEGELLKYRRYAKPFAPIRFLNLLPLSHMFGQAMATFIPPMLPGVVVFLSGYSPREIVNQIHSRRISVLVCVPKILEVLREYILSVVPEAAHPPAPGAKWWQRWWHYRKVHDLLGWKFWSLIVGAAPLDPDLEEWWSRLGFVVIQGYGLTETAPIVSLNHPFHTRKGTVGKPIHGVEVHIADDGEILVRGDNVTSGYLNPDADSARAFADGWFHTGDVGSLDESGRLTIRGRKKEMIVTPEGLNVFPEDIEKVLNASAGVQEAAVVGADRVQAVLVMEEAADTEAIVRKVNSQLEDHQRIRAWYIWPEKSLPRTEGTGKLRRRDMLRWVESGGTSRAATGLGGEDVSSVLATFAPNRSIQSHTSIEELGLSSLERVELLLALERRLHVTIDEDQFASAETVADLERIINTRSGTPQSPASAQVETAAEPVLFPRWNRSAWAQAVRRVNLPLWLLPLANVFAWVRASGLENLNGLEPPVIFAPSHQSHLDVPALMLALPAKWRYRLAPAMSKEFFRPHFFPQQFTRAEWFTNSLNYYLSSLAFNAFPFPQREAGAKQTMRYAGELVSGGWCIVIFPEGKLTDTGEIGPFQPGVGLLASRLGVPVVPVKLIGLDQVLHRSWRMAKPGKVEVRFGKPLYLTGDNYTELAARVEAAVRDL
ncbi:MAG: AMP-binding protein [Bryobacteraceae bacterium]|nr:AMP-binding protein [Bryobacteraceae bacterium]